MIHLLFKNPNSKQPPYGHTYKQTYPSYVPPTSPLPPLQADDQQQKALPPPSNTQVNHTALADAAIRASKIGISTEEWLRRDSIVRKRYAENSVWKFGDTFYPSNKAAYERYGKCLFKGAVSNYAAIDHTEWPANDNVLIFNAQSLDKTKNPDGNVLEFICNISFLSKTEPTV